MDQNRWPNMKNHANKIDKLKYESEENSAYCVQMFILCCALYCAQVFSVTLYFAR